MHTQHMLLQLVLLMEAALLYNFCVSLFCCNIALVNPRPYFFDALLTLDSDLVLPFDVLSLLVSIWKCQKASLIFVRALISKSFFLSRMLCALVPHEVVFPLKCLRASFMVAGKRPDIFMETSNVPG